MSRSRFIILLLVTLMVAAGCGGPRHRLRESGQPSAPDYNKLPKHPAQQGAPAEDDAVGEQTGENPSEQTDLVKVQEQKPDVPMKPLVPNAAMIRDRAVALTYDPEQAEGYRGVELWFSADDGNSWFAEPLVQGKPEELRFTAPEDGQYFFKFVRVDRAGVREMTPGQGTTADRVVIVDTAMPKVILKSPNGGNVYRAGQTIMIEWSAFDAHLDQNPVSIQFSTDDGANWHFIKGARDLPNTGRYSWTLPMNGSDTYRLKVYVRDASGNVGEDRSDATFAVDGLAPTVTLEGPHTSTGATIELAYSGGDVGGSTLARVLLYATRDGGQSWEYIGEDDVVGSPFTVKLLDGQYGLRLVGEDGVGNRSPVPVSGTPIDFRLTIDSRIPELDLLTFMDEDIYAGGQEATIQWIYGDANPEGLPIQLKYTIDDGASWLDITEAKLPAKTPFKWILPKVNTQKAMIKVIATDLLGNQRETVSKTFGIDSNVPRAEITTAMWKAGTNQLELQYDIAEHGYVPVESIELYLSQNEGRTWKLVATDDDRDGYMVVTMPKASPGGDRRSYGLNLIATTNLGRKTGMREAVPSAGSEPERYASRPAEVIVQPYPYTRNNSLILRYGEHYTILAGQNAEIGGVRAWVKPKHVGSWEDHGRFDGGTPEVKLDLADGEYEIYLAAVTTDNILHYPPRSGDNGQIRILVDATRPSVVILTPTGDEMVRGGKNLDIRWEASDMHLATHAIDLFYSTTGTDGPWMEIVNQRTNTGSHLWEVPEVDAARAWVRVRARDKAGNESNSISEIPFVIDSSEPVVSFARDGIMETNLSITHLPVTARDIGPSGLERIELWISTDQRNWDNHSAAMAADQVKLNVTDNLYYIYLRAVDKAGNATAAPVVGTEPMGIVRVDTSRPFISLEQVEEGGVYGPNRAMPIGWRVEDSSLTSSEPIRIQYRKATPSKETENDWRNIHSTAQPRGTYHWDVPRESGEYLIRIVAIDKSRNKAVAERRVILDAEPPMLAFQSFNDGGTYMPATAQKILWTYRDANPKSNGVTVSYSTDGEQWSLISSGLPYDGSYGWTIPAGLLSDSVWLKIDARDEVSNIRTITSMQPFRVAAEDPILLIDEEVSNTELRANKDFALRFRHAGAPIDMNSIELEGRREGEINWAKWTIIVADNPGGWMRAEAPKSAGTYEIALTARDLFGKVVRSKAVEVRFGEPDAPIVILKNLLGGELLSGGDARGIFFEVDGSYEPGSLRIDLSIDGGRTFDKPLMPTNAVDGGMRVKFPMVTTNQARIRVMVTNQNGIPGSAASNSNLTIDSETPYPEVTGPIRSNAKLIEVPFVLNGHHFVDFEEFQVWISSNNGKMWESVHTTKGRPKRDTIIMDAPPKDGVYGIYITARKANGLATPRPMDGQAPMDWLFYGDVPMNQPKVALEPFPPGDREALKAGTTVQISWAAEGDTLVTQPVTIFLQEAGKAPEKLASGLPARGDFEWKIPTRNIKTARIVVTALGKFSSGSAESRPFTIDGEAPDSRPRLFRPDEKVGLEHHPSPPDEDNDGLPDQEESAPGADQKKKVYDDAELIRFANLERGQVIEAGLKKPIALEVDKSWVVQNSVKVFISRDGGYTFEQMWPVRTVTGDIRDGFIFCPEEHDEFDLVLRVRAKTRSGQEIEVDSPPIGVESGPPAVKIVETLRTDQMTLSIRFAPAPGNVARLQEVTLFYRPVGTHHWVMGSSAPAEFGVYHFVAPAEARYHLALVASNVIGTQARPPLPVEHGQLTVDFGPDVVVQRDGYPFKDGSSRPSTRDGGEGPEYEGITGAAKGTEGESEEKMSLQELLELARHAMGRNDYFGAAHYLKYAAAKEDKDPRIWHRLGLALQATGMHPVTALRALETAVELEPLSPTYQNDLGSAYLLRGLYPKAEKAFEAAGDLPDARLNLGILFYHTEREREARELIHEANLNGVNVPLASYYLASFAERDGRLEAAIRHTEDGLAAGPGEALRILLKQEQKRLAENMKPRPESTER